MTHRPQLAVLLTDWGSISHGFCIASKLIEGLEFQDRIEPPRCDVVAVHLVPPFPEVKGVNAGPDIGRATATANGIPLYHSVAAALCRGGEELAVDGVVIVGEHGSWPQDRLGRFQYPRRELFDQVCGVFRQARRSVPVFNDKELSWNWPWTLHMWHQIQELQIPFMGGSSIPWLPFEPHGMLPAEAQPGHVVVVGWGNYDRYGFHALELGQHIMERRMGAESGVSRVRCVTDSREVARLDRRGEWPAPERQAAFESAGLSPDLPFELDKNSCVIDVEYLDGHRLSLFLVNPSNRLFAFAYRELGSQEMVAAFSREDPLPRLMHMSCLVRGIEELMISGCEVIPVERTVLTSGMLGAGFASQARNGAWVDTPHLNISYAPTPLRPELVLAGLPIAGQG